ncbi:MAG: ABC transporter substrate-binding protein [Gemmatimonadota bacterium]
MTNRRPSNPGILLSALAVLAACDQGVRDAPDAAADVAEEQRYGGTAVVAGTADLQSMNSLTSTDSYSNSIQREMLFAPLIKYDADIEPMPWLAERWDTVRVAPDSIDLVFHLRSDIRWHDGEPTTAEDVRFTFERAVDPATAFANVSGFDEYSREVEVIDDYTIRFRLRPHSDFLDMWYQTAIMPEHLLGDVPPGQLMQHPFGTSAPIGNGPFRFVRRVQGQEWVFEANPDFPGDLGGQPYVDRFVYRVIPEMTTLLTELLTGSIDVYLGPNPNQAGQIEAAADARLMTSPTRQWNYLAFNTRRPLFEDARVRRAIAMGLDREQMIDALVYGYGTVGRSTVTPAHWSYDDSDPETRLPYDSDAARELLAEAGWEDRDGDGVLENAEGREFRFTLITNAGNDVRGDIIQIVQAQLRPLGIVVEPRLVEWNTMTALLQDRERNFDAVVAGWVDYFRKDDRDILHSENIDAPFQYVGYANARVDVLIDTVAVMTDREAALPFWREYQRLIVHEAPYIPLYYPQRLAGVRERLRGVVMDLRGEFATITDWWILPGERRGAGATAQDG